MAESAPEPGQEALEDDQDRDKRYLPFGGSVDAHAHGGGGGSGNFLFDLIRVSTASSAAWLYWKTLGHEYLTVAIQWDMR